MQSTSNASEKLVNGETKDVGQKSNEARIENRQNSQPSQKSILKRTMPISPESSQPSIKTMPVGKGGNDWPEEGLIVTNCVGVGIPILRRFPARNPMERILSRKRYQEEPKGLEHKTKLVDERISTQRVRSTSDQVNLEDNEEPPHQEKPRRMNSGIVPKEKPTSSQACYINGKETKLSIPENVDAPEYSEDFISRITEDSHVGDDDEPIQEEVLRNKYPEFAHVLDAKDAEIVRLNEELKTAKNTYLRDIWELMKSTTQEVNGFQSKLESSTADCRALRTQLHKKSEEIKQYARDSQAQMKECAETKAKIEQLKRAPIQLFDCKICYENFDAADRRPFIMKCGHTYCEKCLEQWPKSQRYQYRRNRVSIPVTCPSCNATFKARHFKVESFATPNFILTDPAQQN